MSPRARTPTLALALALALLSAASDPAAAQDRGRLDRVRTATLGAVLTPDTPGQLPAPPRPSGLLAPSRPGPEVTAAPAPESAAQGTGAPEWGWEAVALTVGGALTVGSLTEYIFGERLGMTGIQAGAFAGGVALASWGGIRLGARLD